MLTIWLARHGETDSNAAGMYQGQLDVPLNARGEEQARRLAAGLARLPFRFDAIYASDLGRAARTAEIVATANGLPVSHDPNLREMHYGALQGVRYDRAAEVLAAHGVSDSWGHGLPAGRGFAPPDGESLVKLRRRARTFVVELDQRHPPDTGAQVLVVSHGGLLRVLLTVLLELPSGARLRFGFANCGVSRLTRDERITVLDFHNRLYE